jgi:hypothetical protein
MIRNKPLDAVVVCGMGPVSLKESDTIINIQGSRSPNLVARNVMNFLNAISAKLLVVHDKADTAILSGWKSQKGPGEGSKPTVLQQLEMDTSEAKLLKDTYDRTRPRRISTETNIESQSMTQLEEEAKTTFGNVIQAINMLDKQAGGLWQGKLGVVSSEFHGPRISEMIKAFGLSDRVQFLSAERILKHFGYEFKPVRTYPEQVYDDGLKNREEAGEKKNFEMGSGFGKSWSEFEEDVYRGQPVGLQNLWDNPAYVTFELANISNNQRFWEVANNLKRYYVNNPNRGNMHVVLPECFKLISNAYDPSSDFANIKAEFAKVKYNKHSYSGSDELVNDTVGYRQLAKIAAEGTDRLLEKVR